MSSSTSGVSQSAAEPRAEALTFKVMRLNRPNFWTAAPSSGLSLLLDDSCMTTVGNSSTLCFPAGFGNIYLGETFQAYISACNNGAQHLTRLEVRAEIQTGTKRLPLLDGQAANSLLPSFAPRQCADFVVSHELKEAGVHIMICSGSYLEPSGEEKKVRQYFKFQVQKPLSVTTKLHFLNNTILLENQIQNMTKAALSLGVIKFEPTAHYSRQDLTIADPEHEPGDAKDVPLFGAETVVRPGDVRQFVFRLVPRSGILNASDKASFDLGRLEMAWQTCLGEPGRLHSLVNMQQWKLPAAQVIETWTCGQAVPSQRVDARQGWRRGQQAWQPLLASQRVDEDARAPVLAAAMLAASSPSLSLSWPAPTAFQHVHPSLPCRRDAPLAAQQLHASRRTD